MINFRDIKVDFDKEKIFWFLENNTKRYTVVIELLRVDSTREEQYKFKED